MWNSEIRGIQVDLAIFTHIPAIQRFSRIIQTFLEPCVTLGHLETWFIENLGKFRARNVVSFI